MPVDNVIDITGKLPDATKTRAIKLQKKTRQITAELQKEIHLRHSEVEAQKVKDSLSRIDRLLKELKRMSDGNS